MTMAPVTIRTPPIRLTQVSGSPKNSAAYKITKATLSLSIGATREAGPTCKAWKSQSQDKPVAKPENIKNIHAFLESA